MAEGGNTSLFGDIIAGLGDVTPNTLNILSQTEMQRRNLEREALDRQSTESYRNAQLGIARGRLDLAAQKAAAGNKPLRPIVAGKGADVLDPNDPTKVLHHTEDRPLADKFPPRPGGNLEKGGWKFNTETNQWESYAGTGVKDEKSLTEEQLVRGSLREKLGREPTFTEIADEIQKRKLALSEGRQKLIEGEAFSKWPPEAKAFWFENVAAGNPPPRFAWGDKKSYDDFGKEFAVWQKSRGVTGGALAAERADLSSLTAALRRNTQMENTINAFVTRIDYNITTINKLQRQYGKNEFGRMLNLVQNHIRQGTSGSGDLASLQLALISTSNEIAKVESGSLGIAEVSANQADTMKRIHDWNLNAADLDKVLKTSKELGNNSIQAMRDSTRKIKADITALGTQGQKPPTPFISPRPRFKTPTATKPGPGGTTYYNYGGKDWFDSPEPE